MLQDHTTAFKHALERPDWNNVKKLLNEDALVGGTHLINNAGSAAGVLPVAAVASGSTYVDNSVNIGSRNTIIDRNTIISSNEPRDEDKERKKTGVEIAAGIFLGALAMVGITYLIGSKHAINPINKRSTTGVINILAEHNNTTALGLAIEHRAPVAVVSSIALAQLRAGRERSELNKEFNKYPNSYSEIKDAVQWAETQRKWVAPPVTFALAAIVMSASYMLYKSSIAPLYYPGPLPGIVALACSVIVAMEIAATVYGLTKWETKINNDLESQLIKGMTSTQTHVADVPILT
jgi:hypothetical protein